MLAANVNDFQASIFPRKIQVACMGFRRPNMTEGCSNRVVQEY